MIKGIIFDMDGVLFESLNAWFKLFNKTLKEFCFKKITKKEFLKNCWSVDSSIIVPRYFPGKRIKAVTDYYKKHFFDFMEYIKLMPDVKETLAGLRNKGLKLAIATNTYKKQAEGILKKLGLYSYFDVVVAADEVKKGKPSPYMILEALKRLKLEMDEIYFIGDTAIDIETCKNAKCRIIGFKIEGDKKVDELKELLRLVR